MISPIAVGGSLLVLSQTKQRSSDTSLLMNPFRGEGMLIDEITFTANCQGTKPSAFLGNMYVDIDFGEDRLTSQYLPIWLLGKNRDPASTDDSNLLGSSTFWSYSWKLIYPIFVPPGGFINPSFWNRSALNNVTINFSMRGRSIGSEPPPKKYLPWVASYLPDPIAGVAYSLKSSQADLYNPFDKPLFVTEFVGRIKDGTLATATATTDEFLGLDTYTLVRMYDSQGRILVRDKTPFGLVFSTIWKYWAVNSYLDPRSYYRLYLDGDYSNPDGLGATTAQPMVSMIGYREI